MTGQSRTPSGPIESWGKLEVASPGEPYRAVPLLREPAVPPPMEWASLPLA